MTAFINRLYIYLNSIDINPENFEYDVNYEKDKYKLSEFNDDRCILRYQGLIHSIRVYIFNKTFSFRYRLISMICVGNINNSGCVVLFGRDYPMCNGIYENFLAEQDLMENYLNHRYCMIEFFSAFDIKYDICRAQGLGKYHICHL